MTTPDTAPRHMLRAMARAGRGAGVVLSRAMVRDVFGPEKSG
jgi:hypothetical protein